MLQPASWQCRRCRHLFLQPPPEHAWVEEFSGTSNWTYVCDECRAKYTYSPSPSKLRCFDCGTVDLLDVEDKSLQTDPDAILALRASDVYYMHVCAVCLQQRTQAARDRADSRKHARAMPFQLLSVREMTEHFRQERKGRRKVYSKRAAVSRAVEIQMLVDEAARFPEFVRWLHRQGES